MEPMNTNRFRSREGSSDAPNLLQTVASARSIWSERIAVLVLLVLSALILVSFGDEGGGDDGNGSGSGGNSNVGPRSSAPSPSSGQGGNVGGSPTNTAPQLVSTPVPTAYQDEQYGYALVVSDADKGDTLTLPAPRRPSSLALTDNGSGKASLSGTSQAADLGVHPIERKAIDARVLGTILSLLLTDEPPTGVLVGSIGPAPAAVNLSSEGTADWAHWGRDDRSSLNRKFGVFGMIGNYVKHPVGRLPIRFTDALVSSSWSDGVPTGAETGTTTGLYFRDLGNGFEITVAADTERRTLNLYLGGFAARGLVEVSISDGSAAPIVLRTADEPSVFANKVTIDYRALSAGESVRVRYTLEAEFPLGNVTLLAATVSGPPAIPALPFSDDFQDGDSSGWVFVDDSDDPSDWRAASGRLEQRAFVENKRSALDESYQLGTYAYLSGFSNLDDYQAFVEVSSDPAGATLGNGYGMMFRYRDNDNYYRVSLNARYGHARLERKVGGQLRTLGVACLTAAGRLPSLCAESDPSVETLARAVDGRGYIPGQTTGILVRVVGPLIQVFVDDDYDGVSFNREARIAAYDASLLAGSIALYSQDASWFDNVSLQDVDPADPDIVIAAPLSYSVMDGKPVVVSTISTHTSGSEIVEFFVDGASCPATKLAEGHHSANCGVLVAGEHTIEANLVDGPVLRTDTNVVVGVGENRTTAGDSITNGIGDTFPEDNESLDGRIVSTQGYQATLGDLLSAPGARGVPQIVMNEGIGGDDSMDLVYDRLDSILRRHPNSGRVQVLIGTNDAPGTLFTPAGLGCSYSDPPLGHQFDPTGIPWPSDCAGTIKGHLQWIVNKINAAGKVAIIARIPPAFGKNVRSTPYVDPITGTRNRRVRDYNTVITSELVNAALGPNFYNYFLGSGENRFSLFADNVHPNSLGHKVIAYLWRNAITGAVDVPLVLSSICVRDNRSTADCQSPLTYKQNLMTEGNQYYVDEGFTLQSIPRLLDDGVWLNTENAHRNETRADLVEFTVDRAVTVYVAYDNSVPVFPAWMFAAGFTAVSSGGSPVVVDVSGGPVSRLRLYEASYPAGVVTLGGANAGATGAGGNYIVIVKE